MTVRSTASSDSSTHPVGPASSHGRIVGPETRLEDRIPLKSKLAYGAAGVVDLWSTKLPPALINPIFVAGLGVSPALVSLALVIFRLYDAMLDPVVGWISDNLRTRWGRRKPFILVGAILTGLWFPVMWHANPEWSQAATLAWLIGSGLVFYTFFTLWAMPYQSMLLEMTPDYHERTSASSWRSFFGQIANLSIGWVWYLTQLPMFSGGELNPVTGAQTVALMAGLLVLGLGPLPVFFVKERYYKMIEGRARVGLRDNFRRTFANRPFALMAGFTLLFCCACSLNGGLGFYLRLYYVVGGDQAMAAKLTGVESTLFAVLGLLSIPCFNALSRRVGKTWTLMTAMGLMLVCILARWWTYTPLFPWLSVMNGALLAPAFTGIWQIIPSINGDVVDHDELGTGDRREGAFASIYSWIVKASFSLGIGLSGPVVIACGFEISKAAAQSAGTFTTMRIVDVGLGVGLLGPAMALLWFYPLSPQRMQRIRQELEARRGLV